MSKTTGRSRNPFETLSRKQKVKDSVSTGLFAAFTYFILACAIIIIGKITIDGLPVILKSEAPFVNTEFFTKKTMNLNQFYTAEGEMVRLDKDDFLEFKENNPNAVINNLKTFSYAGGGIIGPLVGTFMLVLVCMSVALFVGISASVYLNEYARKGKMLNAIRLSIMNLAGVPSIVYGLFGAAFFVHSPFFPVFTNSPDWDKALFAMPLWPSDGYLSFQGWGESLLAGGLTLAVMALPVIIAACEESLKAVPKGFREASLALGATKWQMIRTAVLPYATPGILTASVLGITRVAGETAPIMFTAAVAGKDKLPWEDIEGTGFYWLSNMMTQSVQALPYHIYSRTTPRLKTCNTAQFLFSSSSLSASP
jgi:phosphate transport system permease protein